VAAKVWALADELVDAWPESCGVAAVCPDSDRRLSSWAADCDGAWYSERHVPAGLEYQLAVHGSALLQSSRRGCWTHGCRRRLSMARSAARHDRERGKGRCERSVALHAMSVSLGELLRE